MPSWQSKPIRGVARLGSYLLSSRQSLDGWRSVSGMGAGWNAPPGKIKRLPAQIRGVRVEWLIPGQAPQHPLILYFHGGGWVLGWYASHRRMTARIADISQTSLLAVDYRLAPEYPFPAALDDCLTVYLDLLEQDYRPEEIIFAGDSAGGNLVLAAMLALKQGNQPLPAAGVCLSPATDLAYRGDTYRDNAEKEALLPIKFVDACVGYYLAGQDPRHPLISPIYGDLTGLSPLLIQVGGDELLLSDAVRFTEKAREAGVAVTLQVWEGMWHVWQAFAPYLPEANQAIEKIAAFTGSVLALKVPRSIPLTG